jgi:hypothetical protein
MGAYAEPVAIAVLLILAFSLLQGMRRGASDSAKHLFYFIWESVWIIVSLILAARTAIWLSPAAESLLQSRSPEVPSGELNGWEQIWYTLVTSLRDYPLLRFGVLFLLGYLVYRSLSRLIGVFVLPLFAGFTVGTEGPSMRDRRAGASASRTVGALFGAAHGAGRSLVFIAALFIYVSLVPAAPFAASIASSPVYQEASLRLLEPVAGRVIAEQGPVLTRAVEVEFKRILQRRYEIIDREIPEDIREAALSITQEHASDEAKARALYDWIGTRIAYDWDKANDYTDLGIWKEQTPEETFRTRTGVCIDVARLYAVMARTAGLDVRVVTGLGADGKGGYGPHAWNEVLLADSGAWIPLDATWASSGDWFNPPGFDKSHIREV